MKFMIGSMLLSLASAGVQTAFVAKTLGSNMVLQRDVSASIYGYSLVAGSTVSVVFNGETFETVSSAVVSNAGGFYWQVDLPPTAGGFTQYDIAVSSSVKFEAATLTNVVFGDVYLCGGQSNMQFAVPGEFGAEDEITAADKYSNIRLFSVNPQSQIPPPTEPWDDLEAFSMPWSVASSSTVTNTDNDWAYLFSAVCWEFGKNTFDNSLHGEIPVGLVSSNWGGTFVEAWSPPSALAACGVSAETPAVRARRSPHGENSTSFFAKGFTLSSGSDDDFIDPNVDSSLFNSMIYPFRNMKLNGAIWYQGESNVQDASGYPCLQNQMLLSWRETFKTDFGFLYTQLSTWDNDGGSTLADMRNAQLSILALGTPGVGMISAADLGDPDSPYDPIHPRNKKEVGRRMALAGSSVFYGANVPFTGPMVESYERFVDPVMGNSVRVVLNAATCGEGCKILPAQECAAVSQSKSQGCGEILLQYKMGSVLAVATMESVNVVVFTPTAQLQNDITGLSYCQGDYPLLTVYSSFDVPLVPISIGF
jgi:sialate O-acetylesterase